MNYEDIIELLKYAITLLLGGGGGFVTSWLSYRKSIKKINNEYKNYDREADRIEFSSLLEEYRKFKDEIHKELLATKSELQAVKIELQERNKELIQLKEHAQLLETELKTKNREIELLTAQLNHLQTLTNQTVFPSSQRTI